MGAPKTEPLTRVDDLSLKEGLPTQLVEVAQWPDWLDEDYEDIRLLGFGESFLHGNVPEKLTQPGEFRVPEVILEESFDHRVDLWRTGCMVSEQNVVTNLPRKCLNMITIQIYAFLFQRRPFNPIHDVDLVFQMIGFAEKLPAEWQSKWAVMKARLGRQWKGKKGKNAMLHH